MEKKSAAKSKNNGSKKNSTEVPPDKSKDKKDFFVVGLGASAGGVKALQEFFASMPPNSGMAFVVILHLSPQHESSLPEILQAQTTMPVVQVRETHQVEPNYVYVIPPNSQLAMVDGVIRCEPAEKIAGTRVAIDRFFRTLAEAYQRNAVCVVLSGTGSDGTLGLKRVKESNGFAIVQSPDDAEYEQMPRNAIATGLADWVMPVRRMPEKLIFFRDSSERLHLTNGADANRIADEINAEDHLREILTILRVRTGHDFANYKTPTLIRRIARHLQIHELEDLPTYLDFLRDNPEEVQSLQRNLLINVTNFFRDKDAFNALETEVIPLLFNGKTARDTVRVWSAGCASGEEAFSLAMLLTEYAEKQSDPPRFQIFGTDVDDEAVQQAREHLYPETIEGDVSPERLKRFFVRDGSRYRVKKELREQVLFAPHNLLRDPPFSRLDLVVCRNLLIYVNREAQDRVLEIFHFALKPDGFMFLGSSESAENAVELFTATNKKQRIYRRRHSAPLLNQLPKMPISGGWRGGVQTATGSIAERVRAFSMGEVHYKLLESLAPPSVLVNHEFDIVYMSESVGRYLRFAGGKPSNNLLKIVKPDLQADLRAALFVAQRERQSSEYPNVPVEIDGRLTLVNLSVRAVDGDNGGGDLLLVIFDEAAAERADRRQAKNKKTAAAAGKDDAMQTVVRRLEDELQHTRSNLRATVEQHEISVAELKASMEELQAINEELRSATEELETSKEELQSVNEEMATVNSELKDKMDEAARSNADLQNLLASTDIATIFLDRKLRLQRYSPLVESLFNVLPTDLGRPFEHLTHHLNYGNLTTDAREVLRSLEMREREIFDRQGRVFLTRFAPYRTTDDRIEGVVLNFLEITKYKRAEEELQKAKEAALNESEMHLRVAVESADMGTWEWDLTTDRVYWNEQHYRLFGMPPDDKPLTPADFFRRVHPDDRERLDAALKKTIREKSVFDVVFCAVKDDGATRWMSGYGRVTDTDEAGRATRLSGVMLDITDRRQADEALRRSEESLRLILESAQDYAIVTFDLDRRITRWNAGAERMFGYTETEVVGKTAEMIFTPEDLANDVHDREFRVALEKGRAEDERFHVRKDGTRFFVSGVMQPLKDGEVRGFVKIARDRTEKMDAAKITHEKEMLRRLVAGQEEERKRLARDLHDHLGQQLTTLRMNLEALRGRCGEEALRDEIRKTEGIVQQIDSDVTFLAWELRPSSLDDLGLTVALSDYLREWQYHTRIEARFLASGLNVVKLPPEIETTIYRIAQEALNNIYKHARASRVSVILKRQIGDLVLIIEDDGIGFDAKKIRKNQGTKGLGIKGIGERAALVGGTVEIESKKKHGTTVFVRIPYTGINGQ